MVSTNTTKRMGVELPKVLSIATRSLPPCNSNVCRTLCQYWQWRFCNLNLPLYGMKSDQKQSRHCTELVPTYVQVGRQQR